MGADATDIGKTIHPHPTTSESVGMAAEVFEGVCTDLPPQRKKVNQDQLKRMVAREALKHVVEDAVVGVGSGSTVFQVHRCAGDIKGRIDGAVAASEASAERLKKHGIRVFDLNSVNELPVYIDGADEITEHLHMIKGGGGALTREKITGAVAGKFVCICDASKLVPVLGKFPLPWR
jgi:ribose 5-phosphate isomerase A